MSPLYGHEEAVAAFRSALDSGRLHHAWLVTGPEGIGKALFARKAALRVLAQGQGPVARSGLDVPEEHQAARLVDSGTHPDFRLVKREVWGGKPPNDYIVPEDDRAKDDQPSRSIRVKQIRLLSPFFTVRPTFSDKRTIVIDAADDFEPSAANAILKVLEEPPAGTVFFLISHSPERLLPTIRSRCRLLRLAPLSGDDMTRALGQAIPDATPGEIEALAGAGAGSPGRAMAWRGLDVDGLDKAMQSLAAKGDPTNRERSALAQNLSVKSAQPRYEAFLNRAPSFIAAAAQRRRGAALNSAIRLWNDAQALSRTALRQSLDPQATVFEMAGLVAGLAPGKG